MSAKKRAGLVYFIKPIGLDGPIKIGHSYCPQNRVLGLGAWSPFALELIGAVPGTLQDERFLHGCFSGAHSHREWFHASLPLQQAIKRILAAGSIDAVRETLPPCGKIPRKPRAPWSDDRRRCRSYYNRIARAQRKLQIEGAPAFYTPADVRSIIEKWQGGYRRASISPSPAEISRLDEFLADPAALSVVPHWKLPKDPICIPIMVADAEMAA